ncbi:MAG: hypothetical protein OXB86_04335 [Bdellovibrionales bacterium]|nr:hypothetical protein [Bdellovibrionales bacterium]
MAVFKTIFNDSQKPDIPKQKLNMYVIALDFLWELMVFIFLQH